MTDKNAIEFQVMQQQLQALKKREQMMFERYEDLARTRSTLEEMTNVKGEALIPIGSGNFVTGTVTDSENVIIGVGSGVAVKKKRIDAIKVVEERMQDLEKAFEEIKDQGQEIMQKLGNLQQELQKNPDKKEK